MFWMIAGFSCVFFVLYTLAQYVKLMWPSRDGLPEPSAWPFLGHLPYMWKQDHEEAKWKMGRQVKDKMFNVRLMHDHEYAVLKTADFAKALLSQPAKFGRAGRLETFLPPATGSVLCSELADHNWQRMLLARAFTPESLREYIPVFCKYSKKICEDWKDKIYPARHGVFQLQSYMTDMTLDIIGECGFGYQFNCTEAGKDDADDARIRTAFRHVMETEGRFENRVLLQLFPILSWMPFGPAKAFRQSFALMDNTITGILRQRKKDIEEGTVTAAQEKNILSILLRARASDARMTDKLIGANIFVFMLAGHETTATSLTWLLYLLAQNPLCQEKIREEIEEVLPNAEDVTYESAMKLHYIDGCVKEALRLFPPVETLGRIAKEPARFGDHVVSTGKFMRIWFQFVHKDETIYPEPLDFKPERWLHNQADSTPGGFLAFGLGPYECIGKKFAMLEMKTFLVYVMRGYRLEPDPTFRSFRTEILITRKVDPPVSVKLMLLDQD